MIERLLLLIIVSVNKFFWFYCFDQLIIISLDKILKHPLKKDHKITSKMLTIKSSSTLLLIWPAIIWPLSRGISLIFGKIKQMYEIMFSQKKKKKKKIIIMIPTMFKFCYGKNAWYARKNKKYL